MDGEAPSSFLRSIYELFFNFVPWFGWLNFLNMAGDFWTAVWSAVGIPIKIVGF